jgi:hypothetical protein
MRGAIPPLPHYVFMAWCLVKHRDNFTFYTIILELILGKYGGEVWTGVMWIRIGTSGGLL